MAKKKSARLATRNGKPVMLQGVTVSGDLRGLIFDANIEQRFCNASDKPVELIYTFPLPWGAVILGVDVQLGERRLAGAVVENIKAGAQYEEAISEGNAAIMLERNQDQSYSLNIGNLAPAEVCVIAVRYAQTLQFEQQNLRLLIPTVISPRYGDQVVDGGLQPHQATSTNIFVDYPFDIELRIHGNLAGARVASPSHPIAIARSIGDSGQQLVVSLGRQGALDRDFVLVLDQLEHDSVVVTARDWRDTNKFVAAASFCPHLATSETSPVDVKILVDCSGSMAGDSIEAAKRALQEVISQFRIGDRFSLSRFGTQTEHRWRGLWSVRETTRLAASRWVARLKANMGNTEMEAALTSTFALKCRKSTDVLLVTDGEISAIDATITAAKTSGHRVFVVGIGSSVAEIHLRRLAEATGGACDLVAPGEAVEPAVLRMFARLRSPHVTNLTVVWPDESRPLSVTPIRGPVFDGDTVNVFALHEREPVGDVRLIGRRWPEGRMEEIGNACCGQLVADGGTTSRIAAYSRLMAVVAGGAENPANSAQAIAVDYQLVSEFTKFILVHERSEQEKSDAMPVLHQFEQMMPAGWGGFGSVLSGAQMAPKTFDTVDYLSMDMDDLDSANSMAVGGISTFRVHGAITPSDLRNWLLEHPRAKWPKTYAALSKIGLPASVLDWLELIVGTLDSHTFPEEEVVHAFIEVMATIAIADLPAATETPIGGSALGKQLTGAILLALHDISAALWPDAVYAMEEQPGGEQPVYSGQGEWERQSD